MRSLESFKDNLKGSKESNWAMICQLILFSGKLLGYGPRKGARCYSPVYWRNSAQYYTFKILDQKTDSLLHYYDKKDAVSIRKVVAQELKEKGLDCFTGPKTQEGLLKIKQANTKHGFYSTEAMLERVASKSILNSIIGINNLAL